jgi:hypothetical protein
MAPQRGMLPRRSPETESRRVWRFHGLFLVWEPKTNCFRVVWGLPPDLFTCRLTFMFSHRVETAHGLSSGQRWGEEAQETRFGSPAVNNSVDFLQKYEPFNSNLMLAKRSRNNGGLPLSALGWNRTPRDEGPGPETGRGFFDFRKMPATCLSHPHARLREFPCRPTAMSS